MNELIERQAALEKVRTMQTYKLFEDIILVDKAEVQTELMMLPTVQPEPHEGHWINGKCDLCGEHAPFWCMASTYHESNYCPNCGARMVKGERQK